MLTTKRPTRTTVQYTVSTRSHIHTLTSRAINYGLQLLRILATFFVLILLLHDIPFLNHNATLHPISEKLWILPFRILEQHSSPLYRFLISSGITFLVFRRTYTEESLLVIRGLGVQTSTIGPWSRSTRFIPTSAIQDVFLYEAFKGFEVRFYLGIVVDGEEGVVVVFPSLLPRREILEEVWRGARACLYEPKVEKGYGAI